VDVKIITPGKNDDKEFVITMNRGSYPKLMQSGIKIYEYNGFIHSKYLIVDDEYVFTGSYNLDFRSLYINFENAVLISSKEFANQLKTKIFNDDLKNSSLVDQNFIDKNNT